ncbi:tyrosine-type recombinase/integrase [Caminibacter sp.]
MLLSLLGFYRKVGVKLPYGYPLKPKKGWCNMSIYIRCPNCKSDQNIKSKVCKKCGKPLPKQNKRYKVIVKHNGKTVTKTIHNSLELARKIEAKIKAELEGGEYYDRKKQAKENVKYEDYVKNKYLPQAQSKKTYRNEESFLRIWILPVIGKKPLKNISPFDIEKIKKTMTEAGKSPRTIQYALAVIRQTFNKAVDWGIYTGVNPVTKVKAPRVSNRRIRHLTPEEAQALLNELKKHSKQWYEISLLSLRTGMRAGEVFNLKFGDLDFANGIIHVRDTKNGEDRVAYMTEDIADMLSSKQGEPNELIFKDTNGGKIQSASKTFFRVVDKLGLNKGITDKRDKVVFHTLRHTFASWLAMQGTPIYTIKELMGHKTLAMTERYSHLAPDTKREAVRGLETMLSKKVVKVEFGKE